MKKPEKRLEDMSVSELHLYMHSLGKAKWVRRSIWHATKEEVYPKGYAEAERIWRRKRSEEDAEHELKLDNIAKQMAENRNIRAIKDLNSRGAEPLPDHHHINHEK